MRAQAARGREVSAPEFAARRTAGLRRALAGLLAIVAAASAALPQALAEPASNALAEATPDAPRPVASIEPAPESGLGDDELYMRHPLLEEAERDGDFEDPFARPAVVIDPLDIVAWDLASAVAVGLLSEHEVVEATWRHTFGAEMRAFDRPRLDAADLRADFVLLQNVASVNEVRQLFPARHWNVVFTRAMLEAERDGRPQRRGDLAAIAYRYRRGLRITGTDELTLEGGDRAAAGLAVRFSHFGDVFWLVTANLPPDCSMAEGSACREAGALAAWRAALDDTDRRIVTGGVIAPAAPPAAKPPTPTAPPAIAPRTNPQNAPAAEATSGGWLFGWFGGGREKITASTAQPTITDAVPRRSAPEADAGAVAPATLPDCSRVRISLGAVHDDGAADAKLGCLARLTLDPPVSPTAATPSP